MIHGIYEWSRENREEMKKGWVLQADTSRPGRENRVDSLGLEETVRNFNRACGEGKDSEFGRAKESLAPLGSPPFMLLSWALPW